MTPVFSTCFEDISLSRVSGYHYHPTLTIHASSPLCDKDSYQIPMLFEMLVCSPLMSATFRLWWCLVDGAQGGTVSVLCSWSSTNHRSGLSLSLSYRCNGKSICLCVCWVTGFGGVGDVGLHKTNCVIKERTHTLSI